MKHFVLVGLAAIGLGAGSVAAAPFSLDLGAATSFAVLAGSTVTNTGPSTIRGDLGVWPGTAVTGFPPGLVTGGTIHAADVVAAQANADLTSAYLVGAGLTGATDLTGVDLGGLTLTPGLYSFASTAQLTGTLVLDAQGDPDAVFLFQVGTALTTASNSAVSLAQGGLGGMVFWQVGSSATLGTDTVFQGSILALASITLDTGATIACGRALARTGAVTLDNNTVSIDAEDCGTGTTATDVPEPATLALLGAGFALAGLSRIRTERA